MRTCKKGFLTIFTGLILILTVLSSSFATQATGVEDWAKQVREKLAGSAIVIAAPAGAQTEAFEAMTPDFERATGIKVRWDVMEEVYLKTKELMDFTSKSGLYDIMTVDGFWMPEYAAKEVVLPLGKYLASTTKTPEWFDYEDIIPAYREGIGTYKGIIYGIPNAGETRYVVYREDIFKKYGKTAPKTMAEFLQTAKDLNLKEPGVYGVTMRAKRGIMFASGWMTTMYQMGGLYFDPTTGEPLLNSPGTVKSLEYYLELLKYAPPDVGTYGPEENISTFMAGKASMWFDTTAWTTWIVDPTRSKVVDKVGFTSPPEGPAGWYGALAGWNFSIPTTSKNREAAWAFIVWMLGKPNAARFIRLGGPPLRTSSYQDPELVTEYPYFPVQLESFKAAYNLVEKGISWIPQVPELGKILDRIGYWGSLALAGKLTAKEACEKMQQDVIDILAEAKR